MVNCMIIDDEPRAIEILKTYLNKVNDIQLIQTAANAIDACKHLRHQHIDLIFLDINMPEVNGFSLLDMLPEQPMVIITTAYTDHALKSYEYNAIDYLHKPIRFERFIGAVEKALKWQQTRAKQPAKSYIKLKTDGIVQSIPTSNILYIQSIGNYAKVVCNNTTLITLITLKELEQKLDTQLFLRIHKSYIVNRDRIIETNDEEITLTNTTLPIGKTYKKYVQQAMIS